MNASNQTFTLALVSGADVHTWDEVDLVDVFAIKRDGEEVFHISFQWGTEDKPAIAQVIRKGDIEAFNLTGISSPFSLIGHVQETLDRALYNVGGEFYADAFFDDDKEIELPLNFKPVMFEGDKV